MRLLTVWAISLVKDEADVIAGTLRHMADEQVDHILVADNLSTDGTRDILSDLAHELPLTVLDDPDPAHYQSRKMSALAAQAGREGATWVVPFDADELWVFRGDRIGVELRSCTADLVTAELFNHFPSAIDPPGADPFDTIIWRTREPAALPKVAFRYKDGAVIHDGNHGVALPYHPEVARGCIEIRHFPYRSPEQFIRKARNGSAALRATDLPLDVGAHWRGYGDLLDSRGPEVLHEIFDRHFWNLSPADAGLLRDPAPYLRWQRQS